jgi:hypothetical protein
MIETRSAAAGVRSSRITIDKAPNGDHFRKSTQTAAQTLALGSGTCRGFAVLMMEALRSFGLATRFVTGYLYDDSSGTTRGWRQHARLVQRLSAWCRLGRIRPDERSGRRGRDPG